ncbi:hypothetical protein [Oceanobacillus salinisoli]|uniref:hypothetical protein n=1 Tax=Oceanobacillus salinisoli TaxID=2678611 RepID=UPI0012E0DE80|nr:hypothetical protein [Oceanobacillus salinisoli]
MADKKSSEGKEALIYYCFPCDKDYVVDPADPRKDGRTCNQCGTHLMFKGGVDYSSGKDKTISAGTLIITADVSDAIKGLKAIQREAKKATAALKELESIESKISSMFGVPVKLLKSDSDINKQYEVFKKKHKLGGYKPQTVVVDEMHTMCHKCGSERTKLQSLGDNVKGIKLVCEDCGWTE